MADVASILLAVMEHRFLQIYTSGHFAFAVIVNVHESLIRIDSANNTMLKFNLLKPTGHVMHQQFNIQQVYALPTLYLCVLYLSENKQRLVPLTA